MAMTKPSSATVPFLKIRYISKIVVILDPPSTSNNQNYCMSIDRKWTSKKKRALEVLLRLKRMYPDATCSLDYTTPVQLLIATILSAQCTDERVNKVTPALFARFPDARSMAYADILDIEELVRSTGFYHNKAKNIQGACRKIVEEFGG